MTYADRLRLRAARRRRIRQVKAILRYLPRRASLHRYPVIKWFHATARQRPYLWSFKSDCVARAIFWGCIIAFLPIIGVQMFVAMIVAMWARANLPVTVALQWISNPGTLVPLYLAEYKLGDWLFRAVGARPDSAPDDNAMGEHIAQASSSLSSFYEFASDAPFQKLMYMVGATGLGGLIIGLIVGTILSVVYRAGFRFGFRKLPPSGLTYPQMRIKYKPTNIPRKPLSTDSRL